MSTSKTINEPLEIKGSNIFGKFDSVDDLEKYFDNYSQSDRYLLSLGQALTINTIVNMMVKYCDGKAVAEPIKPLLKDNDTMIKLSSSVGTKSLKENISIKKED